MVPVYFPHTYVSEPIMNVLGDAFKRAVVYQPLTGKLSDDMKIWVERGRLSVRTPDASDDAGLDRLIAEYEEWAALHQASGLAGFKARGESVPFFDESSVSRIRKEIREGRQKEVVAEKPDPYKNARIFLQIAQEFDRQQDEIRQKLASFEAMQQDLYRNLKGADEKPAPISGIGPDREDHMAEERLMAWARLFVNDPEDSGLFITGSRGVVEEMIEKTDRLEKVWGPGRLPDGIGTPAEIVDRLSGRDFSGFGQQNGKDTAGQATFSFYVAREISPVDFFSRFVGGKTGKKKTGFGHTVIGLIK